ncbi:MAG: laccase domain-containing protein [Acidimicrobiales bacterium]|nr:laccase domain-containing protein [Acidimicrobiales bacterium]
MFERLLPAGPAHHARVRVSTRAEGDFHVDLDAAELAARRQGFMAGPWTWLRQVHGCDVVAVDVAGAGAGSAADASVTDQPGAVLAVQTADCAPVVLVAEGAVAVAHAGWRGIVAGVIPNTVDALRARSHGPVRAVLGPVVRPHAYEFGEDDLATVAALVGPEVRARTATGRPALDVAAAVAASLGAAGVEDLLDLGLDTADDDWFSHRVRGDAGRQVTTVTLEQIP